MKQVKMNDYGSATVLEVKEASIPKPEANEVLIKVQAAGVNYSDILRRKNTYFMPTPLPYVLGSEAVGTIEQTGSEVSGNVFSKGSRVLAILPAGGGYSEYVIANAQYCVPLPPNVSDEAATALFVQGSTAYLLAHEVAGTLQGKTVLIHAAAGGVGSLLVQLAKRAGAKVIAATGTTAKLNIASDLGADLTVNYTQPDWTTTLVRQNEGAKVDLIFEMVGGKIYEASINVLKAGGSLVVYGAASGEKGLINSERFVDENQHLLSFNLAHYLQHHFPLWQQALGKMIEWVASGQIKIQSPNTYPLAEAIQAHRDIEARKTSGKVVLLA